MVEGGAQNRDGGMKVSNLLNYRCAQKEGECSHEGGRGGLLLEYTVHPLSAFYLPNHCMSIAINSTG